jgi:hypothetical protein
MQIPYTWQPVRNQRIFRFFSSATYFGDTGWCYLKSFSQFISTLLYSNFFGGASDDACFVASINCLHKLIYCQASSANFTGNTSGTIGVYFFFKEILMAL